MMKRLVIILLIVLTVEIASPCFTALAQPAKTPHENPDTATGSLDKASLLLNYSRIFFLAGNRQYTDALEALEELGEIDIPDEFRYIINRYNDLCQQLFTTLDSLEAVLDETSSLIESNKINEAKTNLDEAEIYVRDAEILLEDLNSATDTLTRRLGVFEPSISDELREASRRLEDSMEQLKQLMNTLTDLKSNLNELYEIYTEIKDEKDYELFLEIIGKKYTEIESRLPTGLTLNVSPASAYVGDTVSASGRLQSYDEPLAGRSVSIMLGGDAIATVTTREDGSYSSNITLPYKYQDTISAVAVYEPQGDDTDKYLACRSPEVTLHTGFYATRLELSAPAIAYPGMPFNISGEVISAAYDIERNVEVTLDDTPIAAATVSGEFSLEMSPPIDTTPGQRNLTVRVAPQGRYAGASEQRKITVALMPLEIDLETPGFIFLPGAIRFDGSVRYELGPVPDALIIITSNDREAITTTASDGSFTAALDTPLDFSFLGQRDININIAPLEPWAGYVSIKRQVVVINPVFTGLALLAAVAIIIIATRRRRPVDEKYIPREEVIRTPAYITPRVPAIKLTGIKGRVISAYRAVLLIIERIAGVRMKPEATLREFLATATKLLPKITRQFTELTVMAESALYSDRKPPGETANTAERITDDIKKELRRGA